MGNITVQTDNGNPPCKKCRNPLRVTKDFTISAKSIAYGNNKQEEKDDEIDPFLEQLGFGKPKDFDVEKFTFAGRKVEEVEMIENMKKLELEEEAQKKAEEG